MGTFPNFAPDPAETQLGNVPIFFFARLTAGTTFLLLIAGSLVTSTNSGLAVPDWPLSYGTWFPPMIGGILYEHGHRMIAGLVGLLIFAQAIWIGMVEPRRWVRRLAYAALGAVIAQALLGGLTVLLLLPPQISIAHACLGQTVLCLTVCLAVATSPRWIESPASLEDSRAPSLRTASLLVAVLAGLQLFLGAVIRHTGTGVWLHALGAITLAVSAGWCGARLVRTSAWPPALRAHGWRLLGLVGLQLLAGLLVLRHRGVVTLRTAHVAIGALVLAQALLLAWELRRRTRPIARSLGPRLLAYLELTKPRLSALVLVTTGVGFWLGMQRPEQWRLFLPVLLGTALTAGGANALNEWMECDRDALMERTKRRPLPDRRMAPEPARRFGLLLVMSGVALLALTVNILAAVLAAFSAFIYLGVYTPMKRLTPLCTLAGAIPGALPPMIGWAGARQALGPEAWMLFALLFLWQLPHFLAIAVLYRSDYARAGFQMLPVTESTSGLVTARHTALCGLLLVPASLFPTSIGLAGPVYFLGALTLGLAFLMMTGRAALTRSRAACQRLFLSSVLYLPVLLGLMAWDRRPLW